MVYIGRLTTLYMLLPFLSAKYYFVNPSFRNTNISCFIFNPLSVLKIKDNFNKYFFNEMIQLLFLACCVSNIWADYILKPVKLRKINKTSKIALIGKVGILQK